MIFFLAKFFHEEEYANDFVRGRLFANRLAYFKQIEGDDGRGDEYEGAIMSGSDDLTVTLTPKDAETGEELSSVTIRGDDLAAPIIMQPRWFDHISVFCMYASFSGSIQNIADGNAQRIKKRIEIPEACLKLGKHAVVITNTQEFLKRVKLAAERNRYRICGRLVRYYDPDVGTPPVQSDLETIFTKRMEYQYQSEFRFAIDTGDLGCDATILDVGNLDDIAICLDTSDINQ